MPPSIGGADQQRLQELVGGVVYELRLRRCRRQTPAIGRVGLARHRQTPRRRRSAAVRAAAPRASRWPCAFHRVAQVLVEELRGDEETTRSGLSQRMRLLRVEAEHRSSTRSPTRRARAAAVRPRTGMARACRMAASMPLPQREDERIELRLGVARLVVEVGELAAHASARRVKPSTRAHCGGMANDALAAGDLHTRGADLRAPAREKPSPRFRVPIGSWEDLRRHDLHRRRVEVACSSARCANVAVSMPGTDG